MDTKTHYMTWANSPDSTSTKLLKQSALNLGIEVTVLDCTGLLDKIVVLRRFLESLPQEDIVVCTDGYDVLYVKSENSIISRFKSFESSIVFGGEKGCYHHLPESKTIFESLAPDTLYPYLNSGLMIGYISAMKSMLEAISNRPEGMRLEFNLSKDKVGFFNDQTIYGWYFSQNTGLATIDTAGALFWTLSQEKYDINQFAKITQSKVENLEAKSEPCIVHVSHLKKFYPVYLYIAWKMGVQFSRSTINQDLLHEHRQRIQNAGNKAYKISDREFSDQLIMIDDQLLQENHKPKNIAIIFIGTGRYVEYFEEYYKTAKQRFLPSVMKTFFVFSDTVHIQGFENEDVVCIEIPHQPWPFSTLLRFRCINTISRQLASYSHVIYLDADMYVYTKIDESELFFHDKPLFGVQHPGLFSGKNAPFEFNAKSTASVNQDDDLSIYWQGCFWGGEANHFLQMSKVLEQAVDKDLSHDVIAKWHDESHLNKYFSRNRHLVHTFHPGFAYPESMEGKLDFTKKIVHIKKQHQSMRAFPLNEQDRNSLENKQISSGAIPILDKRLDLKDLATSNIVKQRNSSKVFKLNETSAMVLQLCNGSNSAIEIIEMIKYEYLGSDLDAVSNDVYEVLETFSNEGLIIFTRRENVIP